MLRRILDRPIAVTMALLVVIVLGIVSLRMLPVSLIPDMDIPYVTVQVSAGTLSAREIDETIGRPLCQQFLQLSSLEDIQSESRDGSCKIKLSFSQGADIDYLFIEVNEKIDRSMGWLKDIDRPKVFKSGATDIPAFYVNVTLKDEEPSPGEAEDRLFPVSEAFRDMSAFVDGVVAKRLEQLEEVAMVDISGGVDSEILLIPDTEKLRGLGMTEADFENIVKSANIRLGSLSIRDGEYRYNIKFQSFASNKKEIEDIYVNHKGKILQIKDIAKVIEHPSKRSGLVRSNGKEAITMAVIKQSDAKMADLKKNVRKLMRQFGRDYPEISFEVTRDQTELLEYSINNLVRNIIAGVLLACVIIFLFMRDFRSPALVALTIPTALIASMLVFHLIGLSINIISLSGLVLGVGMMVDNTIILTDNITSRWLRGDSLRTAVLKGTSDVAGAMLSSVLTTCAVFIPLIFVSGIAGAMFYDQAMSVTIVLLTSYLVTVTVIPVYYMWWYGKSPSFRPNKFLARFSFDRATAVYENGVQWLLGHRWAGWGLFLASAVGAVALFSYMPKEKLPEITYTDTILKVDWNEHLSLEENTSRVRRLEELAAKSGVEQVTSMVGAQRFVLSHSGEPSVSEASIYLKCSSAKELESLKDKLSGRLAEEYPSSLHSFEVSGNIFDMVFSTREADLVARLRPVSSPEVEADKLTNTVEAVSGKIPGAGIQAIPMKTDLLYVADPERMALYDISYGELVSVLRNALNENSLFGIIQGNKTLPVVMGVDTRDINEIIGSSFISKPDREVPVSAIMRQTFEEDLKYVVSGAEGVYYPMEISLDGKKPESMMAGVREAVREEGDFDVSFSGEFFSNKEMAKELVMILLVAVLLLYLILASQFESLVQPLIILSEIVIDIFGALAVLWACGVSVNLMSMIGLVVICGIVINDSILKIDTINKLRGKGVALREAITQAGQLRLKAIVMTSLTTILSVCPFLARGSMGDDLQYPMSLVIIAGMVIGTIVSLLFVPMVYYEIYHSKEVRK